MNLKIGGKDYQIHFGFDAINYLDTVYKISVEGYLDFGIGLNGIIVALQQKNLMGLLHFIKAGTSTEPQKPSNKDIEEFIGSLDDKAFDGLFKEALEEIKKSPLTRVKAKEILKEMEKGKN